MRWRWGLVLGALGALLIVPAAAQADVPPPSVVPGTTVITLGAGFTNVIAADAVTGRLLLAPPSGEGLQVRDADGGLVAAVLGTDQVVDLVFDPVGRLFWATLPYARQLASIDPVTLVAHRYDAPTAAGCPQQVAVAGGLVVFISPFLRDYGCPENPGFHALDPATGTFYPSLAQASTGVPQFIAATGGLLYAAEIDNLGDHLATYTVTGGLAPAITMNVRSTRPEWTRDLAVDPDTGNALIGGADNGHLVVTSALTDASVQPLGTYHRQVEVAAAPGGLMAFSPWAYGSSPGDDDLFVYRGDQTHPAATYDLGRFDDSSGSEEINSIAFGRNLYTLGDYWNGTGVTYSYLRIFPLPAAPTSSPPSSPAATHASVPRRMVSPSVRVRGGHLVVIRWKAPRADVTVSGYVVTIDGRHHSEPGSRSRLRVGRLAPGNHRVTVAAINSAGSGEPSRPTRFHLSA